MYVMLNFAKCKVTEPLGGKVLRISNNNDTNIQQFEM